MKAFGILGVVIALCAGLYLYQRDLQQIPEGSPQQQIDTVAIRQRLLTIGQAERTYQATNGKYGTLEELANAQLLSGGTEQRGYSYTADVSTAGFTITAAPNASDKANWPTLSIVG